MKLRKHKNKSFAILWAVRTPRTVETHLNSDGTSRKVSLGGETSVGETKIVAANDGPSALRAFLFGRDASNISAHVVAI